MLIILTVVFLFQTFIPDSPVFLKQNKRDQVQNTGIKKIYRLTSKDQNKQQWNSQQYPYVIHLRKQKQI